MEIKTKCDFDSMRIIINAALPNLQHKDTMVRGFISECMREYKGVYWDSETAQELAQETLTNPNKVEFIALD